MRMLLKCLSVCFVVLSSVSHAEQITYQIHQDYVSPRALGMGNAFIALADDYNTLFYNPAGLARMTEGQMNLKLQFGLSSNYLGLQKDIAEAGKGTEAEKPGQMIDLVAKNYGNNYWLRPSIGGLWTRPNWGVAFIPADVDLTIGLHQQLGPNVGIEAYADSTLAYGYAKSYMDEKLSVGATFKAVHRAYAGKVIPAAELAANSNFISGKDAGEGLTGDVDIGLLYSFKSDTGMISWMKPNIGFVARNLIDAGFKQNYHLVDKQSGEPPKLGRKFDVGFKSELPKLWVFSPRFLVDIKDMGHQYFTVKKGAHAGFELNWDAFSWLRGGYRVGYSQGYLTAGISAQLIWFRIDLATWADELGTTSSPQENRRYMVQMSLDF